MWQKTVGRSIQTRNPNRNRSPSHPISRGRVTETRNSSLEDEVEEKEVRKLKDVDEEEEEQDEDYEGEDEPEGDDEEHPEPEGEDPSGSVNQINQMTMCVRGKCGKPAPKTASSSSTERVVSESHRVDEINLSEKFQSIGAGDPKRRWLVDSGATCHIISERWLSHYKVVYRYEVGIPVLKGAGDNVLPTRGMVDLECKVGKIKVIMRKVVICALDLNVLSSYSLHEQGWETRLGTLKVSGLYHKKVKFPLKISDRAWWLEVLVLKNQGKSSRNQKGNGFFFSLAERAITAVPVTALQKEAIVTSSAMPRIHQAETKQTKGDKTKSNQAKQTTQHQPNTNQSQTPEWKQSSLFLYNIQLK